MKRPSKPGIGTFRQSILLSRLPAFLSHVQAHEAVITDEAYYGDGPPALGKAFTAAKAAERQAVVIDLLFRAARRAEKANDARLAASYGDLADAIYYCRPNRRCGSLACTQCARAFQKAKVAAQLPLIADLNAKRRKKTLVFVCIVPEGMTYKPGQFASINITKSNRWLKDKLKPIGTERPIMGSADFGWETRRGGKYIQLHWHLAMWTSDPVQLEKKLKTIFRRSQKYERPVNVTVTKDLRFLPYQNKAIKLPALLRENRKNLPELWLALNQMEPLDLLVLFALRLSAQKGRVVINELNKGSRKKIRTPSFKGEDARRCGNLYSVTKSHDAIRAFTAP